MNQAPKNSDSRNNNSQKDTKLPPEVFDSSKHDAMNDMTKGASTDVLPDRQAIIDLQRKEPLSPDKIDNKSLTSTTGASSDAKINPMTTEERGRTILEINEGRPDETNKAVDLSEQDSYALSDWNEGMMRQYMTLVNTSIELYSQFLKSSIDLAYSWFNQYQRSQH